jgi:hypothetical protein
MANRNIVWTVGAASLFVLALTQHGSASGNAEQTAYLTFSQVVRLPGVSLGAGTYIFEVANPNTRGNVVRVLSRDRKMAYFLGFTNAIAKPRGLSDDARISLGESGPGAAPPITAWWPTGEAIGREFIYRDR